MINSLDFAKGYFAPHGRVNLTSDGRTITTHSSGPFNLEGVLAINAGRIAYLLRSPPTNPYSIVAVWRDSVMMSLEALHAHRAGLEQAYIGNCLPPAAVAWVADGEVEGFMVMAHMFKANFASVGIPMETFQSRDQANAWLLQHMPQA